MVDNAFFEETRKQSEVKARIVAKYFAAWARVIAPSTKARDGRVAYADLFAGPGRYVDGTRSTPLLILENAIARADLRKMLVSVFNDKDEDNVRSLQQAIAALPGIETLKHEPQIERGEVGEGLAEAFKAIRFVPSFFFVDPWGYKGLSLGLIQSVIKDWGCDCVFFFNYNRINMGLGNPLFKPHLDALFGSERADKLREALPAIKEASDREALIIAALVEAIQELGGEYVLPFRFRGAGGRTSHHLIFVSKGRKGYDIMKEIMAKESPVSLEGVPSFEFSEEADAAPRLFYETATLSDLKASLLVTFAGLTLTMQEVFDQHNVGTQFLKRHYKIALLQLEMEGKIDAYPSKRKKNTFADDVKVTFRKRG
jgi:three-Cys-motif partner protein